MRRPIKNCYWVVPKKFLAGEYPREYDEVSSIKKITPLLKAGITSFIDLTHPDDHMAPYRHFVNQLRRQPVKIRHYPIPDFSIPDSKNLTSEILNVIDLEIKENGMVYLHCWGGIGRTGTIVGCWLSRHGYNGKAALRRLHELWKKCPKSRYRNSPESIEQEQYIINWDENQY
ncbi:MAG: hypothetical protein HF978_20975 [Desulfobacteraceae bacterium]|nr:dual specificity protein phosphatase family protein [Desulfobacteraceae bacterium]MBC2758023.1 hypothetical protein [Desulfobacteraceae bacterium]